MKETFREQDVGTFKQGHVIAWQSLEDDRPLFLQECVAVIEREKAWFLLRAYRHPKEEKGRGWRLLFVDDAPLQPFAEYSSKPSKTELMAFMQRSWWHFGGRDGMTVIESGICESVLKRIFDMSLGEFKEPNQTPQHNAGSRPSSGDSSASETLSSLGPRG